MRSRLISLTIALALGAGVVACGDDDDGSGEAAAAPTPTETAAPADVSALAAEVSDDTKSKPAIPAPSGDPPTELVTEDIVEGKGRAAKAGDNLTMQYVGVSWSNGQEFDASWDRGEPFVFQLGAGMVIPGWDQGLEGMKKGGRRLLAIPPELAYGPQGSPPVIGPNETLVFVVDLVKIGRGRG
jgi:peptidylprolyl isomerase